MANRVGVALLGVCRTATSRLAQLSESGELGVLWVVEENSERAARASKELSDKPQTVGPSYTQLALEDPRVDAVVVNSSSVNVNTLRKALHNGKAVFCATPFFGDLGGLLACEEEASAVNKPFFSYLPRRFDNKLRTIKEEIASDNIGRVEAVRLHSSYGQSSGELFHGCAVNELDLACWLLGEHPESVFTQVISNKHTSESSDPALSSSVLKFSNGCLATTDVSKGFHPDSCKVEVYGSKGLISLEQNSATIYKHVNGEDSRRVQEKTTFQEQKDNSFHTALKHFLSVYRGTEKSDISLTDSLRASLLASACTKSHSTGSVVNPDLQCLSDPQTMPQIRWRENPDMGIQDLVHITQ